MELLTTSNLKALRSKSAVQTKLISVFIIILYLILNSVFNMQPDHTLFKSLSFFRFFFTNSVNIIDSCIIMLYHVLCIIILYNFL